MNDIAEETGTTMRFRILIGYLIFYLPFDYNAFSTYSVLIYAKDKLQILIFFIFVLRG